ncbi:MAG: alpha/beta hydrolase [Zhongshania sp.]|uniref:alpha/beta fold hydrolase n=1 Tax=Zhongshania sp. TaxID=1971902 RepID=UPI00262B9BDD|nr:alpha/beta hydrolase [Zhongshania sp.]MDF1693142.1 alpha/beta hydrolase [Zhongshania sp.]
MLTTQQSDFGRGPAIWQTFGQGSEPLLFAAANGFPIGSYQTFLSHFKYDYRIAGLENRGMWGNAHPPRNFTWRDHADDLIAFLDHQADFNSQPVIAMGHSIGGTVLALAAVKRPDLFKAVLMFDPATIPGRFLPMLASLAPTQVMGRTNLVKRTKNRQQLWPSRQAFIDYHRHKAAYRHFSEPAFTEYAEAGLIEQTDGQFKLAYSREWEAHNFQHTYSPWQTLRHIQVPSLILRAEHSYLHKPKEFESRVKRLPANVSHQVIQGVGHMALQEDGEQVVKLSRDWLSANKLLAAS